MIFILFLFALACLLIFMFSDWGKPPTMYAASMHMKLEVFEMVFGDRFDYQVQNRFAEHAMAHIDFSRTSAGSLRTEVEYDVRERVMSVHIVHKLDIPQWP